MLSSSIKALDFIEKDTLEHSLVPVLNSVWPNINKMLEVFSQSKEIVLIVCNLYHRTIKALTCSMVNKTSNLLGTIL
jgi:hypothetical protein